MCHDDMFDLILNCSSFVELRQGRAIYESSLKLKGSKIFRIYNYS